MPEALESLHRLVGGACTQKRLAASLLDPALALAVEAAIGEGLLAGGEGFGPLLGLAECFGDSQVPARAKAVEAAGTDVRQLAWIESSEQLDRGLGPAIAESAWGQRRASAAAAPGSRDEARRINHGCS